MKRFSARGFVSFLTLIIAVATTTIPLVISSHPKTQKKDVLGIADKYVTGKVLDQNGNSLSGAYVSMSGGGVFKSQTTSTAGFAFIVPIDSTNGTYFTVAASKAGYNSNSYGIRLYGTSTISIRLTKPPPTPTPTPVKYGNLTVCSYISGGGALPANITIKDYSNVYTGADGCNSYTFVSGRYLTITAAPGNGYSSQTKYFTVGTGNNQLNFYFKPLTPPTPVPKNVSLKVCVYKNGGGLINADVSIKNYSTVNTGSDGCNSYTFPQGKSLSITAKSSGFDPQTRNITLTKVSTSQQENFYLKPPATSGTIQGYVWLDGNKNGSMETDERLGGITVYVGDRNEKGTTDASTKLYKITNLPLNRTYTLSVNQSGYVGSRNITLSTAQASGINIKVTKNTSSTGSVVVRTQAATGTTAPISGASVKACPLGDGTAGGSCKSGTTNSNGEVVLTLTSNLKYSLSATKGTLAGSSSVTVSPSGNRVVVTLKQTKFLIYGKVTDKSTGKALSEAKILLYHNPSTSLTKAGEGLTLSDGSYQFPRSLDPGEYQIIAQKEGYISLGIILVKITSTDRKIDFPLEKKISNPITPQPSIIQITDTPQSGQDSSTPNSGNNDSSVSKTPTQKPTTKSRRIYGQLWMQKNDKKSKYTTKTTRVRVTNKSGQTKSVSTLSDGSYEIPNLTQSSYKVELTVPSTTKTVTSSTVTVNFTSTEVEKKVDFTLQELITSPSPTKTVTPSSSSSPSPSPTITPDDVLEEPSISPTISLEPSVIPTDSEEPLPSEVPTVSSELIFDHLYLHGIGSAGDNASPFSRGNFEPIGDEKEIKIQLTQVGSSTGITKTGSILFDADEGTYSGIIDLDTTLSPGVYVAKLYIKGYLRKTASPFIVNDDPLTTVSEKLQFITGDVNDDNKLNILDYDVLIGCQTSSAQKDEGCTLDDPSMADITSDGKVDLFDLNLLLRELTTIRGDE